MNKNIQNLIESGLTENEARVYYAGLSLGPSTVLRISQVAQTNRVSSYALIDSLIAKGLMSKQDYGLKTLFVAEHPSRLKYVMEQRMEKVNDTLPDLIALHHKNGNKNTVSSFEGIEHAHAVYERIMQTSNSKDFVYFIGGDAGWKNLDISKHTKYQKWLSRNTTTMNLIFADSERAQSRIDSQANPLHQTRIFPKNMNISTDIIITPQFVCIMNLEIPITTVVIEDSEVANSYKELFSFIWRSAQSA